MSDAFPTHIECLHCGEAWDWGDSSAAARHVAETMHDVALCVMVRHRIDSIAMAIDGTDPEDIVPALANHEEAVYDLEDEPYLVATIRPPLPLDQFVRLLQSYADEFPDGAVKQTADGYEVWSASARPDTPRV